MLECPARTLGLCLLLAPGPVLAQDYTTSAGPVSIVASDAQDYPSQELLIGGVAVDLGDPAQFLWIEAKRGDFLLIGKSSGGNACPAMFVWVNVVAAPPATREFGTCSEVVDLVDDGATFVATLSGFVPGAPPRAFIYDGSAITEMDMPQPPSASPPADGALPWVGGYAYDLIVGADWRDELVGLMGEQDYAAAPRLFALGSPMEEDGEWVVGSGCDQIVCDTARGAIALHKTDHRILLALTDENGPRLYGVALGDLPTALAQIMGK